MKTIFEVDESFIVYGMRYALGRRTYAVNDVCSTLKRVWKDIEPHTRYAIQAEIKEAIDRNQAGTACDVESWKEILELPKEGK